MAAVTPDARHVRWLHTLAVPLVGAGVYADYCATSPCGDPCSPAAHLADRQIDGRKSIGKGPIAELRVEIPDAPGTPHIGQPPQPACPGIAIGIEDHRRPRFLATTALKSSFGAASRTRPSLETLRQCVVIGQREP